MTDELKPKFETVMIIDDNTIDLYISSRLITKNYFGKKVLEYSDAKEAIKYLQENQDNISSAASGNFCRHIYAIDVGF